jgi:nitrous-oxide reductase
VKKQIGAILAAAVLSAACAGSKVAAPSGEGLESIMASRDLTPADAAAALKTYVPSGRQDEYLMFASGGHSGQVFVIGLPSMRILRSIAVFSPESWQGYGYGTGEELLEQGYANGREIKWGDTHHPGLSETQGDYDGQFLFINDKADARVGVIDLRDFETKQIVKNPVAINDHGGTFVTPNTEYVIQGGQYATPLGWTYAPVEDYQKSYRGMVTLWKFDRAAGRIDPKQSFAIELPPYWQDLFDAGKLASEGWIFGNSINTEMAVGGIEKGNPPFEAGVSQRDVDYLHINNLKAAEAAYRGGKTKAINGFPVIPLDVAAKDGILFFAPEPKSPHGCDVTPNGKYIVVAGKLDPHVSVYSIDKIKATIDAKKWAPDPFGVPILDHDSVIEARVELGLGPLHTQFDDKGYAYTSLFLDSAVARWTLGGDDAGKHPEPAWTLVAKTPTQYNIGHLSAAEGDTVNPDGKYIVALNKWSVDRFFPTGPLLPQNLQLMDIASTGATMPVIYDAAMGIGEPHYAQIIKADKLKPWTVYPEVGWNPETQSKDPNATAAGQEKIVRNGSRVEVHQTVIRSHYNPEHVEVRKGDKVVWHLSNLERTQDATHGFSIPGYNVNLSLEPGETQTIEFVADRSGTYPFYCSEFCSALHLEMTGFFLVKP